ncbi:MAG: DUF1456 family protein [Pseudomonadota bacterium]|nr:hypothetical protein [Pseudomonadales bacterium]MDY6919378.1 DUF1456 family protein [Pseudomonadota bacterium]
MNNNDILRQLRKLLALNEHRLAELYALAGPAMPADALRNRLRQPNEPGFQPCEDSTLLQLLAAIIIQQRGPGPNPPPAAESLTNNLILKKLRVAYQLQDADFYAIFAAEGEPLPKQQLKALFRKPGHKNFMPCPDRLLRVFLKGLIRRMRSGEGSDPNSTSH